MSKRRQFGLAEVLPYMLVVLGAIGFLAAWGLMLDRLLLFSDPSTVLACDVNPFVSCSSVMQSEQAAAFGFPNPLIGIVGFGVVITIGMALLAGAKLARWFWLGLQVGVLFGMGFVLWLFYQTVYVIGTLCPYCMVVWVVMLPLFWYVTLYNLRSGHVPLPPGLQSAGHFVQRHHADILLTLYLVLIGLLLFEFRDALRVWL